MFFCASIVKVISQDDTNVKLFQVGNCVYGFDWDLYPHIQYTFARFSSELPWNPIIWGVYISFFQYHIHRFIKKEFIANPVLPSQHY